MKKNLTPRHLKVALAFLFTLAMGLSLVGLNEYNEVLHSQKAAMDLAAVHGHLLQERIDRSLSATYALAAVLRQGRGHIDNFDELAGEMLRLYGGISALQLAPQGVIQRIVPLRGNEAAMGHDLLADPQRNQEAVVAVESRKLTLAGPFELRQGGVAVIGRLPVFLPDAQGGDTFWGFVTALIRIGDLVEASRLAELEPAGFAYQLSRVPREGGAPQVFAHSAAPVDSPVSYTVRVANGAWKLSIAPKNGWFSRPGSIAGEFALALLASVLVAIFARKVLKHPELLMREIDERKRVENELAQSEARLRRTLDQQSILLENMTIGIAHVVEGRLEWSNPLLAQMFGYAAQEFEGMQIDRLYPSDAECRALWAEALPILGLGETYVSERVMRRKDGSRFWCMLKGKLVNRSASSEGSLWALADITEHKEAEAALRWSEERFRSVAETAHDAIISLDSDLRVIYWNTAAQLMFGYCAGEMAGQQILRIMPERYRKRHQEGAAAMLAGGTSRLAGKTVEVAGLRKNGEEFPLELSISTWSTRDGTFFTSIIRDISDRKEAEENLRRAKETAEAASRAKSDFVAKMSHEIRTPMNGIIGMTELVLDSRLDAEQRDYLEMARSSAASLLTIINDILDFSKIEAGKLAIEHLDFALREHLAGSLRMLALRAREKGVELAGEVAPDIPEVIVSDPARLRQIIVNLVGNAIKFTERGVITVTVRRIRDDQDRPMLQFTVADPGIGIAPEAQQQVFEAFTQADSSTTRRYGGTGLGLTISASLVEMLGGRIWLESAPGKGSRFHFTLPLTPASADLGSAPRPVAHPAVVAAPLQGRRLKVLLAEDNPVNQKLAATLLEKRGHQVILATDGRQAVAAWKRERVDLVLMDIHMPHMDGFEATAAIRHGEAALGRRTPILAMTANAMLGDRERCLDADMDGYVAKPIDVRDLFRAIEQVLAAEAAIVEE